MGVIPRMPAGNIIILLTVWMCLTNVPVINAVPVINSFQKTAILSETVTASVVLSEIECADTGGAAVRVYVDDTTPNSPCNTCFQVFSCTSSANECLEYRSGIDTLDATSASSYLITIGCTNNSDPPVTEVVYVIIEANKPPYFVPETLFVETTNSGYARNILSGATLYTVNAMDDDAADTVQYFLTTHPSQFDGMFEIGTSDGIIRPTVNMATVCVGELTFEVSIYDGRTFVGPKYIAFKLNVPNIAPIVSNLNNEVHLPEDATGQQFEIKVRDRNPNTPTASYTYSSTNTAGLAQYSFDGTSKLISVVGALDYENPNLRETDVVIEYTDGSCKSDIHTLKFVVKDVNEAPVISPTTSSFQVCEGQATFDPGLTVTDEDTVDTKRWSLHTTMANRDGFFGIEPNTGIFKVNKDYDVDKNRREDVITYIVQVEDKGGLAATATVTVTFEDCNDNAPVFDQPFYTFTTTECAAAGTALGTVAASDDDSTTSGNNGIIYSGSSGSVSINAAGDVILQSALTAGSVVTFDAIANDQGLKPGALNSVEPAKVSIIFTECPTTAPPVTAAPVTTAAPTTAAPVVTTTPLPANSASIDADLPWLIIAGLLGAVFIGLLSFMCWKFGSLLRFPSCSKPNCRNPCKRKPKPRKIPERGPQQKPASPLPEVEKPGPGFIFGFWKERFPDNDFKKQPDRRAVPETGNLDPVYPHTIDTVDGDDPQTSGSFGPEKPKKKCCVIL